MILGGATGLWIQEINPILEDLEREGRIRIDTKTSMMLLKNRYPFNHLRANGILMRQLVMCALLLLAFSLNCMAIAPVQIGGIHGQNNSSMISYNPFTANNRDRGDLWSWGSGPVGYGQLFPAESNSFGEWAPFDETPLNYTSNETPPGYAANEIKRLFSKDGQSEVTQYWLTGGVNSIYDIPNEPPRLSPSQGFFSGYGDWGPSI